MVEVLSEIKILPGNMPVDGPIIGPGIRPEPIMKVLKKKIFITLSILLLNQQMNYPY